MEKNIVTFLCKIYLVFSLDHYKLLFIYVHMCPAEPKADLL